MSAVKSAGLSASELMQRLGCQLPEQSANGKARNKVVTAVARELAGFIWAILQEPDSVDSAKKAA